MSRDDMEYSDITDNESELVPAVFARDAEEAQRYCELLADHGIVGVIAADVAEPEDEDEDDEADEIEDAGQGVGMTRGVAVLVSDEMLDEAGMVISDREDVGEFQFGEDVEAEDDDDELEFAQGIDSEFKDDAGPMDLDILAGGGDDLEDIADEGQDDDDFEFGDDFGDEFDGQFDVG